MTAMVRMGMSIERPPPQMQLGAIPKEVFQTRLIRLLALWVATPIAMLVLSMLGLPERTFWALTVVLLAWLFWSVLKAEAADCPYCGEGLGRLISRQDVCGGCGSDLTAPFDPARGR